MRFQAANRCLMALTAWWGSDFRLFPLGLILVRVHTLRDSMIHVACRDVPRARSTMNFNVCSKCYCTSIFMNELHRTRSPPGISQCHSIYQFAQYTCTLHLIETLAFIHHSSYTNIPVTAVLNRCLYSTWLLGVPSAELGGVALVSRSWYTALD